LSTAQVLFLLLLAWLGFSGIHGLFVLSHVVAAFGLRVIKSGPGFGLGLGLGLGVVALGALRHRVRVRVKVRARGLG